eukprot:1157233-Pelagomonas_calceolata.AAC.9
MVGEMRLVRLVRYRIPAVFQRESSAQEVPKRLAAYSIVMRRLGILLVMYAEVLDFVSGSQGRPERDAGQAAG